MCKSDAEIKISVIIPTYNNVDTIGRCIDSVLAQEMDGIEIIVIDDGSTDDTQKLLSGYKSNPCITILRSRHRGQGLARNMGMDIARGEFIGFVDGDDTISSKMYPTLYEKIGDADICQCNSWIVQSQMQHKADLAHYEGTVIVKDRIKYMNEYFFTYLHGHGCCNKLYRKSFIFDNNIHFADNSVIHAEDLYFNILTVKCLKKIVFVDEMLYYYYQYPTSHSRSYSMDKVRRLCTLFDMVTQDDFKYVLARLGVTDICINLTEFDSDYNEILRRRDFRRLIRLAAMAPSAMYQRVILLSLLVLRGKAAHGVITKYYGRFRRERSVG